MSLHIPTRITPPHESASDPAPQWTFFRQWLKNPLAIASLSPSSQHLARQMVAELPPGARRVVELGAGTGVFTRALLEHGIAPADLLVLELNKAFFDLLRDRFSGVCVVCGDACELGTIAHRSGFDAGGPIGAVLSGLGLLSMPSQTRRAILQAAFSVLDKDGRFIQFTYGPTSPVSREILDDLGLRARRGRITWINMPPATIYVYTRSRSQAVPPVRAGA